MLSHFSHVRLCDTMDYGPPGSSVHGILQARILEWVAISFSNIYIYTYIHAVYYIHTFSILYTYMQYTIYIHAVYYIHTYSKLCNHVSGGKELTAAE